MAAAAASRTRSGTPVKIISVVGRKNSGKTTLIERMIPILRARDVQVAVIKHDAHDFSIDHEGKDTWRVRRAGAAEVIIASGSQMAHMRNLSAPMEMDDLLARLASPDLVILEGYKRLNFPKLVVLRDTAELHDMHLDGDPSVVAHVLRHAPSSAAWASSVPQFWADEIAAISEFAMNHAMPLSTAPAPMPSAAE